GGGFRILRPGGVCSAPPCLRHRSRGRGKYPASRKRRRRQYPSRLADGAVLRCRRHDRPDRERGWRPSLDQDFVTGKQFAEVRDMLHQDALYLSTHLNTEMEMSRNSLMEYNVDRPLTKRHICAPMLHAILIEVSRNSSLVTMQTLLWRAKRR